MFIYIISFIPNICRFNSSQYKNCYIMFWYCSKTERSFQEEVGTEIRIKYTSWNTFFSAKAKQKEHFGRNLGPKFGIKLIISPHFLFVIRKEVATGKLHINQCIALMERKPYDAIILLSSTNDCWGFSHFYASYPDWFPPLVFCHVLQTGHLLEVKFFVNFCPVKIYFFTTYLLIYLYR